ncbi:hypothetical protein VP01_379g8 [Puccinia sorghi]|uniref:Uncharacterized protein n=1 Tax=Puccinia sorghi TaxID=27349 RepID=A0A0L6UTF0_9BASI|nr:hypothetical protein VP01_379g8 [Puccinia sorghi]
MAICTHCLPFWGGLPLPLFLKPPAAQNPNLLLATQPDPGIQAQLEAMTGVLHPVSTIKDKLKAWLKLTTKDAHTVNPTQCTIAQSWFFF